MTVAATTLTTTHLVRSRGQISTSTDAIVQHAIMNMNPVLNEPVR